MSYGGRSLLVGARDVKKAFFMYGPCSGQLAPVLVVSKRGLSLYRKLLVGGLCIGSKLVGEL